MKSPTIIITILGLVLFSQCASDKGVADAYGNFETEETLISAESNGKLLRFSVEEGQRLEAGREVGLIDTTQLYLQKQQLKARIAAIKSKRPDIASQLQVFDQQVAAQREQLENLEREKKRVQNLIKADAAPPKQLDEINDQIELVNKQIEVIRSQASAQSRALGIQSNAVLQEALAVRSQIDQVEDQLRKCRITNPFNGIVTASYAEAAEVAGMGKPLYKLADLSTLTLRAYVSGDQLVEVKVGDDVTVKVDSADNGYKSYTGTITWISDKAEFTPKIIQTKKDRVNLVYAMKVKVSNDGSLKMGMPAEVVFGGAHEE